MKEILMSKWRNTCPDKLITRIEDALEARLYLLRQIGPTGFLIKEHDSDAKFKVFLGDVHQCDCSVFLKERDLCIHILWVIVKKFRIPKGDEVVYQLGLVERELQNVICRRKQKQQQKRTKAVHNKDEGKAKEIDEDDVCPICQEEIFVKRSGLIVCKSGCGNSIHVTCMKVWADHQHKSTGEEITKCPLCRSQFDLYKNIVHEYSRHSAKLSAKKMRRKCKECKNTVGRTEEKYRCSICKNFLICKECFVKQIHKEHPLEVRKPGEENWKAIENEQLTLAPSISRFRNSFSSKARLSLPTKAPSTNSTQEHLATLSISGSPFAKKDEKEQVRLPPITIKRAQTVVARRTKQNSPIATSNPNLLFISSSPLRRPPS